SRKLLAKGLYKDSTTLIKNGWFYFFYPNGILSSTGRYLVNRKEGLWLAYHPNGYIKDSVLYDAGEKTGAELSWHDNGFPEDSIAHKADGTAVSVSWYDNGNISAAGRLNTGNQFHGKWRYYHKNGQVSADEIYDNGKLISRKYFSAEGNNFSDSSLTEKQSSFVGGIEQWGNYLSKKLYWPQNFQLVNTHQVRIQVQFRIDENGSVKDEFITIPFDPIFNDIVLRAIHNSPKWQPAISHNRHVSSIQRQTVIFNQADR
ncbi:MAG: hypothetical protein RLZZ28_2091, partial [Bacteroidota bacterium]